MNPTLNIAIRAARKAGKTLQKHYEKYPLKNHEDVEIDVYALAEQSIKNTILKAYPKHTVTSKNSCNSLDVENDVTWIIDPLNGEKNYKKKFPHFSISLAVRVKGRTEVALVYDPIRNELFSAVRGEGAQLNGYRLRCNTLSNLEGTTLATVIPVKATQAARISSTMLSQLSLSCDALRSTGSIALDLAYLASGRIDGFFASELSLTEFLAGELLARESGCVVCDFSGGVDHFNTGNIIAGSPRVTRAILSAVREHMKNYNVS